MLTGTLDCPSPETTMVHGPDFQRESAAPKTADPIAAFLPAAPSGNVQAASVNMLVTCAIAPPAAHSNPN